MNRHIEIHRPSLRAFLRDMAEAAAVMVVTAIAADYLNEAIARTEAAELDVDRMAGLLDNAYRDLRAIESLYEEPSTEPLFGPQVLLDAWADLADERLAAALEAWSA